MLFFGTSVKVETKDLQEAYKFLAVSLKDAFLAHAPVAYAAGKKFFSSAVDNLPAYMDAEYPEKKISIPALPAQLSGMMIKTAFSSTAIEPDEIYGDMPSIPGMKLANYDEAEPVGDLAILGREDFAAEVRDLGRQKLEPVVVSPAFAGWTP